MFFHLLYIHLFRPFLKYKPAASPLPAHVSPRKFLTQAATAISKLLRLYRRTYGLRQICNIVVYIAHSACTIHLLNLPDRFANRDIVHGLNHLEEISESWLCARRTLGILFQVSIRWNIDLPEPAQKTFERAEAKFGVFKLHEHGLSPKSENSIIPPPTPMQPLPPPEANTISPSGNEPLGVSNREYLSSPPLPITSSTSPPNPPRLNSSLSLPPQQAIDLGNQSSRQHFVMPQAQQQQQQQQQQHMWNREQTTQPHVSSAEITSPTMIFGGVEDLMKDQEWWLQDSNQIFAQWNGYEQHDSTAITRTGYPSNIPAGSMGEDMSNDISHLTGNGMGNGMYNNGAYGYPPTGNEHM